MFMVNGGLNFGENQSFIIQVVSTLTYAKPLYMYIIKRINNFLDSLGLRVILPRQPARFHQGNHEKLLVYEYKNGRDTQDHRACVPSDTKR